MSASTSTDANVAGASIVAFGAVSPLGRGELALGVGKVGEAAVVASFASPELTAAGLARPFAAEVAGFAPSTDRAARILASALTDVARSLDAQRPGWRALRIGLAIGTSSGAMRRVEAIAQDLRAGRSIDGETAVAILYASPLHEALREALPELRFAPFSLVLGACASSTMAVGLGLRWLEAGACDLVLAGGFDGQSVLVSAGFEALHATTSAAPPRPFHPDRDGLALGEGAAVLALAPAAGHTRAVIGFGVTCDAFHVTAPDRGGEGLARAAERALADSGIAGRDVDLISAHGTATSFNDAAETLALARVCLGSTPDVHAYKSQSGHTLGAAGALELLAADAALARQVVPASGGATAGSEVRVAERAHARGLRSSLKLSAAFGGQNAAVVLGASARPARASRPVLALPAVFVPLDAPLPALNEIKVARFDDLTRGTVAAVHALAGEAGSTLSGESAGLIVGHTLASFETNLAYATRIDERGVRAAEPRRFPYTSPNACAGEAAIAFGIRGPVFAVGGGWNGGLEALAVACTLVAAGDAESITVVAVDAPGEGWARIGEPVAVVAGAVALRVVAAPVAGAAPAGARRVVLAETGFEPAPSVKMSLAPGHLALLPLLSAASGPLLLESRCPSGAVARVRLDPV
jgi:3-oxoacyl-[acyl-carrier-protein] synthase-1/3-oxoacyl-[acyl-carrier-protein] synthase II